jgi:hypothetical protein
MDSFIFSKHAHNKLEIVERKRTTSTVLVPDELIFDFEAKVKEIGGVRKLFKMLLDKYRILTFSGALPEACKLKTEFQCKIRTKPPTCSGNNLPVIPEISYHPFRV